MPAFEGRGRYCASSTSSSVISTGFSPRASAPYVHAHRGRTFVIHIPGEAAASPAFADLVLETAETVRPLLEYGWSIADAAAK